MLEPWAIAVIAVGAVLMLAAFYLVWRRWSTERIPPISVVLFYAGALVVIFGLQPIRPFVMQYAEAYMLPDGERARAALTGHLEEQGWIVGAAKPARFVDREHPLQPEIAARFATYREQNDLLMRDPPPDFLFAGRKAEGWSRNPRATTAVFVFLLFVFGVAAGRYAVRLMAPPTGRSPA